MENQKVCKQKKFESHDSESNEDMERTKNVFKPAYQPNVPRRNRAARNLISGRASLHNSNTAPTELQSLKDMPCRKRMTKVFSGNKSPLLKQVPRLFDACVEVLKNNIDRLNAVEGPLYNIFKPILINASPEKLLELEYHNPYLIKDTGELWKIHCNRVFRDATPNKDETWRKMYLRCVNEREKKMEATVNKIKKKQENCLPKREVKFINQPGKLGKFRRSKFQNSNISKSKRTPLMQRALSMMKNLFR